jgi:SAM-dependent methyltransferase
MRIFRKLVEAVRLLRFGPTQVRVAAERLEEADRQIEALRVALAQEQADGERALQQARGELERNVDAVRTQVGGLAAALDRQATGASAGAVQSLPPSAAAAEEGFYPLLETNFRGSEALVKERLGAYREWVARMPPGRVADIGCGRGEWLELLKEWGREGVGVDSNALVARAVQAKGLAFEQGDAVSWLQSQADGSLAGVTAFQVVEHLPFGLLLRMLQEAHRALAAGGVLILETPNPENVEVATRTFWLDPTHVRPLPPQLLALAAQYCGFREEALLRVNPPDAGQGASRDYALVASKGGS